MPAEAVSSEVLKAYAKGDRQRPGQGQDRARRAGRHAGSNVRLSEFSVPLRSARIRRGALTPVLRPIVSGAVGYFPVARSGNFTPCAFRKL